MANLIKLKFDIMEAIEKAVPIFIKVNKNQYRIRCPFCGDSQSNPRATHMYIKCDHENESEPILYNCFKANCMAKGRVGKDFLNLLGIEIQGVEQLTDQVYNKLTAFKNLDIDLVCGQPIMKSNQVGYIEWRLGKGFTFEDYNRFKIIWDDRNLAKQLEHRNLNIPSNSDYISFLTTDKSMLLSRTFKDIPTPWLKTKLLSSSNITEYSISTDIDIFTQDQIVVNIAEGIFDVLGIYKHFNSGPNSIYLAVLGDRYDIGITSIISKGIFGKNVDIRIYVDSNINIKQLKYSLGRFKWLFNSITLYTNILGNDVGVSIDKIKLKEVSL